MYYDAKTAPPDAAPSCLLVGKKTVPPKYGPPTASLYAGLLLDPARPGSRIYSERLDRVWLPSLAGGRVSE